MQRSPMAGIALGVCLALFLSAESAAQTGNPPHDAVATLSEPERRSLFHQAVRAGGNACSAIVATCHAGFGADRDSYWDVRCSDGPAYRARIAADRFAPATFLRCGAAADGPHGGPCFQPVAAMAATTAVLRGDEARCTAACQNQPAAAQGQCVQRCVTGQGLQVGQQVADTLPAGTRFGVFYFTDNPYPFFGFGNGSADRLEVNTRAVRACQAAAGRIPCKFQGELVNQCGAVAFAISRHPQAIALTAGPSTQVLNLGTTGRGETQRAAEQEALRACRRAEGPGSACRIVAPGC
ncbi:MAG: DUF4189 domain-containing protein [Acetobacteraceae bacterium]|nr:DUF4189 domain-containing protein [Acetobacteraceae bacterium]